jgi:putative copper export protein
MVPKPPSLKKSAIAGVIMGALYFVFIQYAWKTGSATVWGNLLFAVVACLVFMAVVYVTDRYKYQRYLRKKNAAPK